MTTPSTTLRPSGRRIRFPRHMVLPSILLGAVIVAPLLAPLITPQNPTQIAVAERFGLPSWEHPLGQDEFGRDRLARILYGGQISLMVAFVSTSIACVLGTTLGVLGAYFRGMIEFGANRTADVVLCFPPILLALLAVTLFGPGVTTLTTLLCVLFFPGFCRIAYSEGLRVSALEFVEASRALGTPRRKILSFTILPNIGGAIAIQYSLTAASAIGIESGLSFLGLGVVPPAPSWGQMIRSARPSMAQDPLGIFVPCVALVITIFAINFFCDRLRDTLDPKKRTAAVGRSPEAAAPAASPARDDEAAEGVTLEIRDLSLAVEGPNGPTKLVDNVSLGLRPNRCVALVGESGSGKSLTSLAALGLLPPGIRVTGGQALYRRKTGDTVDIASLSERELEAIRGNEIAMVFQDPMTALNPVLRIGDQMAEAIRAHSRSSSTEARARALELLQMVGINDADRRLDNFPHELSGGMRQRVMIAMALSCQPRVLIADEPTTALDVTIQAEIVELLKDLRERQTDGLSMLFISHNLGVVAEVADEVAVMYCGQIVEQGPVADLLDDPQHPYTQALVQSMPSVHEDLQASAGQRLPIITGNPPSPTARASGCAFASRCPHVIDACRQSDPPLRLDPAAKRQVRCIRAGELVLAAAQ